MPSSSVERSQAESQAGPIQALAALGGALLLVFTFTFALLSVADSVGRYGLRQPLLDGELLDTVVGYFAIAFSGSALLALPAALAAPFVAIGDPPLRSHSAVALVPGCLVALAAAVAAVIGTMLVSDDVERGLSIAYQQLVSVLTSYTMPFLPIAVVLSAALGGARTPEATAAVAAPTLLGCFYALMSETSIGKVLAATLIPGLVGAAATAVCYAFAPARAVTPWLVGWGVLLGMALFIATGLFTPTETAAVFAVLGLAIALPVRVLALGQPIRPILRQAAMETAAVLSCVVAGMMTGTTLIYARVPDMLATAGTGGFGVAAAMAVIFAALSYLATPLLAIALMLPASMVLLNQTGFDPVFVGVVLVLLGLAAAVIRAPRPAAVDPTQSLPSGAASILAAVFLALAVVVVLAPGIALFLATELFR